MLRTWNNDFSIACTRDCAHIREPLPRQKWHIAAYNEVPGGSAWVTLGRSQRGDNSAQRPFARPAVLDDRHLQIRITSGARDNLHALRDFSNQIKRPVQHRLPSDFDKTLITAKAGTRSACQQVAVYFAAVAFSSHESITTGQVYVAAGLPRCSYVRSRHLPSVLCLVAECLVRAISPASFAGATQSSRRSAKHSSDGRPTPW